MYGDFPAKITVYTPYIPTKIWFWPALEKTEIVCPSYLIVQLLHHAPLVNEGRCGCGPRDSRSRGVDEVQVKVAQLQGTRACCMCAYVCAYVCVRVCARVFV